MGRARQRGVENLAAVDLQFLVCRRQHPRPAASYIGGFPIYVQKCNEVMSNGFEGFVIDGAGPRNEAPRVRLTERWRVPLDMDVISPAAVAAQRVQVV